MSMSTHVYGFRPPDGRWRQMKAIWDACREAGTSVPEEVEGYFQGEPPDDAGVVVDLVSGVTEYKVDMEEGYEVDIRELPKDVVIVRFVNAY